MIRRYVLIGLAAVAVAATALVFVYQNRPTAFIVPARLTIDNSCGTGDERKRLIWAVRYMRAAARSRSFVSCMSSAVSSLKPLETAQESIWVGPYFTCKGAADSGHRDPEFAQAKPRLGFEAVVALAQTQRKPLVLRCGSAGGDTAQAQTEFDYFETDGAEPEVIELSLNVFSQYPDHQQGADIPVEHGDLGPSYAVDELAGIILHERLHTRGFEHGNADTNNCGYTDGYECPSNGSPANCRMRSLNEIAEACMSEVIENSLGWCPSSSTTCTGYYSLPMFLEKTSNSVSCECVMWY